MKIPKIKKFKLSQLTAADYNPRVIDDNAIEGLANSISRFGCVEPIVVNVRGGTNTIIGGHQRYRALEGLGVKDVICVTVSCSKADEKLLNLSLNNPAIQGKFIEDISEYIDAIRAELPDDTDYLALRINELRGEIAETKEGLTDDDQIPEPPKKAKTKRGDLYILGNHRLLCGDATKAEDVKRLMGKQKADMVTDPPYGINVDTSWLSSLNIKHGKPACKSDNKLANDDGSLDLSWIYQQSRWLVFGFPYIARTEKWSGLMIWDKRGDGGEGGIGSPVEVAASNAFNGYRLVRHLWAGYIREAGEERLEHPTQKPVGTMMDAVKLVGLNDVCDPFLGSGSTLIAAEKLGRRCFGLEIDPIYCDVIVKRWEEFTDRKAKKKNNK